MKILLFGRNGQVARRLYPALLPLGNVIVYGSDELDLHDFDKLRECIRNHKPDVVVNAAAYTAVDKAESDAENAFAINATAVRVMAEEISKIDAWLVHYSSEYVFNGNKKGLYTEEDIGHPLGIYGQSKLAGDNYLRAFCPKHIILRTSWIYDSYGKNFAKTILTLAQKNASLRVVSDQVGSPTNASLIANITAFILYRVMRKNANNLTGIYNLSPSGETSWYGFAYALIKQVQEMGTPLACTPENIIAISSLDYPTPAKRPLNSRLDTSKISKTFDLIMPQWDLYIPPLLTGLKVMGII